MLSSIPKNPHTKTHDSVYPKQMRLATVPPDPKGREGRGGLGIGVKAPLLFLEGTQVEQGEV